MGQVETVMWIRIPVRFIADSDPGCASASMWNQMRIRIGLKDKEVKIKAGN